MLDVHVVTHTHWDREWYHPLERFQQRLVELIDEVLERPPRPGESFLLDGQAIVLEDYVAIRPEREGALTQLLAQGRLEAGPWFVLADELIPGAEALVRNLLAGRRVLARFESTPPPVLYCPDSFGHPAALPSIARGFDLPLVIVWRGYGGARWPAGDTVRWSAPNGDEVLVHHLSRDGYEFGSHLPADAEQAVARWTRMREELAPRSSTGVLLVPHGADHHARQVDHEAALGALERAATSDRVHRSTLRAFAEQLVTRSRGQRLPKIQGELRDSYGYTWTLQGTFGTRAGEKRLNALAERTLLRDAEPWAALASRVRGRSRRALLQAAWRQLLTAHPHDTLCGTSIDHVADAMELRLRGAVAQAEGIRDDALADLAGHDSAEARTRKAEWQPVVVVRNRAARERSGVAILDVREFVADVPVGPGSAPREQSSTSVSKTGGPWPGAQVLESDLVMDRVESPRHYPDNDLVARKRVAVWMSNVPGYGIRCIPLAGHAVAQGKEAVVGRGRRLQNGIVAVEVDGDGRVAITDEKTGRRLDDVISLEDEGDVGDLYTPAPRGAAGTCRFVKSKLTHRGPVRGELELSFQIVNTRGRRREVRATVRVRLVVDAGAAFVRMLVDGENLARDHRLRFVVRSDVTSPAVYADAAFGPQLRTRLDVPAEDAAMEIPPRTAPLHRYVSLFDDTHGMTVFSDGLGEYEAGDDGTLRVTLVRAVGELSRNDLPERPGQAGWPTPTPGAQSPGPYAAELAVMLHGARLAPTVDAIERTADDVLLPLTGSTLRSALEVPEVVTGAELDGVGLAFSTLKESEAGGWIVARCVNVTDESRRGKWRFGFSVREARLARLDETPLQEVAVADDHVSFEAGPRAIVTVLVR